MDLAILTHMQGQAVSSKIQESWIRKLSQLFFDSLLRLDHEHHKRRPLKSFLKSSIGNQQINFEILLYSKLLLSFILHHLMSEKLKIFCLLKQIQAVSMKSCESSKFLFRKCFDEGSEHDDTRTQSDVPRGTIEGLLKSQHQNEIETARDSWAIFYNQVLMSERMWLRPML